MADEGTQLNSVGSASNLRDCWEPTVGAFGTADYRGRFVFGPASSLPNPLEDPKRTIRRSLLQAFTSA